MKNERWNAKDENIGSGAAQESPLDAPGQRLREGCLPSGPWDARPDAAPALFPIGGAHD